MENAVLFFDDFAFVFDGISDCLFAETEGKKAAGGGSRNVFYFSDCDFLD